MEQPASPHDLWEIAKQIGGGAAGGAGWALFFYEKWCHTRTQERARAREDALHEKNLGLTERVLTTINGVTSALQTLIGNGGPRSRRS